jgi:hypothetical protein
VDAEALGASLSKLRPHLTTIERSGSLSNVFEAMSLGRDEVRNAQILAWFLLAKNRHGIGSDLVDALITKQSEALGVSPRPSSAACRVATEVLPDASIGNRVDVLIDDPRNFIIIEVKIDAGEQPDQVERYCQVAERRAGDRNWGVVYLTPNGRPPNSGLGWGTRVLPMPWIDIAVLLEAAVRQRSKSSISTNLASGFTAHIRTNLAGPLWKTTTTDLPAQL